MGVIVLNKQKPMIFVLGHPSNTYTLHGFQSRKNGVEICNAKPLPIPIYIHNYFFFLTYYEEWDNPQSRVCWTLPMYLPVQFVESIIQYYYCRYICGDDSSELLGDYSRHYPLLPTWLFITSIIIQIVLLIWGVSKILCLRIEEIWKNKRTMHHKTTAKQTECGNPPLMATPVAAGFPSPAEQYIESPLDLNELLVHRPAATFFVRAAGDSMTGAGIRPGDILVVDRSLEARDGSIVIACVDNEFTVKFLRSDGERWYLQPANRKYKPITFSEGMELRIFGVVTAVIHQFVKLSNGKGR